MTAAAAAAATMLQVTMPPQPTKGSCPKGASGRLHVSGPAWGAHPALEDLTLCGGWQRVYIDVLPPRLRRLAVEEAAALGCDLALLARVPEVSLGAAYLWLQAAGPCAREVAQELEPPYLAQLAEAAALAEPVPGHRLTARCAVLCFRDAGGTARMLASERRSTRKSLAAAAGRVSVRLDFRPSWRGHGPWAGWGLPSPLYNRLDIAAAPAQLSSLVSEEE